MPVADTDIQAWGSAVMPVDDAVQNIGGAIDLTKKIVFTRLGSLSSLEMLSSAAGDTTQTVTIYYLTAAGLLASEQKTLNGTNVVAFTNQMLTFLRAVKSASTTGTVTIRKASAGTTIVLLEAAVLTAQLPFYDQLISATAVKQYNEKIFIKNAHATLALTEANISIASDVPGILTFALEAALNGTGTNGAGNNRQVAPAGFTFDATTKTVATGNLTAGDAQGMWLHSTLSIGKNPFDDVVTLRVNGISA